MGSKGGYPTQPPSLVKLARDILDDGVSLVAVDDGTVVGMRTSHVIQRSAARKERPSMEELLEDFPEPHAYLTRLLDSLAYPWQDVFERDPSVGRLFEMYGLAVVGSHRGRGIATELVRQALKAGKAKQDCWLPGVNLFLEKIRSLRRLIATPPSSCVPTPRARRYSTGGDSRCALKFFFLQWEK